MTEEAQVRARGRSKLWIPALVLAILASIVVIPPLVSINRYKLRIARAISTSLGRPARLSSVELRLLPRPGFVITNLIVEEDPAYGALPVLHANEVVASVRLFSLFSGRLEFNRISVDDASLNLVHTADGRWNLNTLFRTAAQGQPGAAGKGRKVPLPYLEATNSRINIVRGIEKLPYSLVNANLSFWEESPGDWRIRVKGQPARTDVSLDLGDTGILQLEGSMRRAAGSAGDDRAAVNQIRAMPIHVEMEWRNAQLGQLSRLLIGSDPGWRGDLTAEMKIDGTAETAQVTTRLRAAGVHRAEFAPAVPLDFDANCGFAYHYSARTVDKLACDSPLGDGRLHLEGSLPSDGQPKLSLDLEKIPAQAILDGLRTVRSQVGVGLTADGSLTGKLAYDATAPTSATPALVPAGRRAKKAQAAKPPLTYPGPLSGSIVVDGLKLSGGSLSQPILIQKAALEPATGADGKGEALAGTANLPAGAPAPLVLALRLTLNSYQLTVHGGGSPTRIRQLAQAAGLREAGALDAIGGDPVTLDLSIEGPWLPAPEDILTEGVGEAAPANPAPSAGPALPDRLYGTVTLHNANWKSGALPNAVVISQATLHLGGGASQWDPLAFVYGPLKGTAQVQVPVACIEGRDCVPIVNLNFPSLDAADLQSALLGSQSKETLLSTLISRLSPSTSRPWPNFQGTVEVDSLILGPVTLDSFSADMSVTSDTADLSAIDAELLGGQVHLTGTIENGSKPSYSLEGTFQKINPADLCRVLELSCTGASFDGNGKLQLAGYEGKDFRASAKGMLHFVWTRGGVGRDASPVPAAAVAVPAALVHFDTWTADAEIANGAISLTNSQLLQGGKRSAAGSASITFSDPPEVSFASSKLAAAAKK